MIDLKKYKLDKISELRMRAEKIAGEKKGRIPESTMKLSSEEIQGILHELQVHQIELEIQIEELHLAYSDLEITKARYFDLYDLAPVGYCTISENGLVLEANLTASTLLGESRGALVKQPIARFILNEDQDIFYLHRKNLFEAHSKLQQGSFDQALDGSVQASPQLTGEKQDFELRMMKKDGIVFWAQLDVTVEHDLLTDMTGSLKTDSGIQNGAAKETHVCRVVLKDITDRKRAESEKAKIEEQDRQLRKAESLARMAGAISHHFNNQLHIVIGYLGMVIGDLPKDDSNIAKLTGALQAASKVSDVCGLLITYLGQKTEKFELLDLSGLCRLSLPILQAGKPKNVVLETDLSSPGPSIIANAKQIQYLLTNLIINAYEAIGDKAGTIHMNVRTVPSADIPESHRFPVEWHPLESHYACLEIMDSGCGIQEKEIEDIFDPFFSTKFTGRGMGLSVALGIARAHGLVITAESKIHSGSDFKVFFPMSGQISPNQNEQIVAAPKIASGKTVLLVDDDEGVRRMTGIALSGLGFTVLQAKDGVEAVEIFGRHKNEIDCLLCDLSMPRMGGWETISALRSIRRDLPVILSSGYDEASAMAGIHPELPDFFLNKPYGLDKLGDAIGFAIARKSINRS